MSRSLRELLDSGAGELGMTLIPSVADRLLLFMMELRKWNRKINLTAITTERGIIIKHLLDSLTVVSHLPQGARLLDLGSGGGFPCIPLALVRPDLKVTSVDATLKKIHFQRHAARLLGLSNFEALQARGDTLAQTHGESFDLVLSRGFSSLPEFVSLAKPLLAPGGVIIAMKGKSGSEEAAEAAPFLEEQGLVVREVVRFRLPASGDERSLVILGLPC
jgi:16S rRNA (guanine527-N7)-methyltransferase